MTKSLTAAVIAATAAMALAISVAHADEEFCNMLQALAREAAVSFKNEKRGVSYDALSERGFRNWNVAHRLPGATECHIYDEPSASISYQCTWEYGKDESAADRAFKSMEAAASCFPGSKASVVPTRGGKTAIVELPDGVKVKIVKASGYRSGGVGTTYRTSLEVEKSG